MRIEEEENFLTTLEDRYGELEVWLPAKGLESYFDVSNFGRIFNKRTKAQLDHPTRLTVGKRIYKSHHMVASTFIGQIPKGYGVFFKDGNVRNLHYRNLEILPRYKKINRQEIVDYVSSHLNEKLETVAKRFGVDRSTVEKTIKKFGVKRQPLSSGLLSKEKQEDILSRVLISGEDREDIAKEYLVSRDYVDYLVKKYGYSKPKLTYLEYTQVVDLLKLGYSSKTIAEQFMHLRITPRGVRYIREREGL